MWFGIFELPMFMACIAILIGAVVIASLVENDSGTGATIALIVLFALLHTGHILNVIALLHSPTTWLWYVLVYLIFGAPWAVVKWGFYLNKWKRKSIEVVEEAKEQFFNEQSLSPQDTIPDELKESWTNYIGHNLWLKNSLEPLRVRDYIGRLVSWAAYWPFSLVYTLLDDPLKRFFQYLVIEVLGKHLQKIANARAAQVAEVAGVTLEEVKSANRL